MTPRLRVEIVEKLVAARLQRSDEYADLLAGGNDFLTMQRRAFEFRRRRILVADQQLDLGAGGDLQHTRKKAMGFDRDRDLRYVGQSGRRHAGEQQDYGTGERAQRRASYKCELFT